MGATADPVSGSNGLGGLGAITPFTSSGTVTIKATTAITQEGSPNPAVFTVTANPAPTGGPLFVTFSLSSTGILGTDFSVSPSSAVNIAAGTTTATITVYPFDDDSDNETLWNINVSATLTSATQSGSGGGSYTIGSPSQATVTVRDDVGSTPQVDCNCPGSKTNLLPSSPASSGGDPADNAVSSSGTRPGSGQITNVDPGLISSGFGEMFGPSLEWTNVSGTADNSPYGIGWVDSSLPSLQQTANGRIMVVSSATAALWFDPGQNGTYVAEFYEGTEYNFKTDGTSGDFLLNDPQGDTIRFYGFETTIPLAQRGQFKSFTDPNGNVINVTSHSTNGQIAEIQRSATTNGVTTTESFLYTYLSSGNNMGLVQNVTLRRKVGTGNWSTVRQAVFTYYDGGGDPNLYRFVVSSPANLVDPSGLQGGYWQGVGEVFKGYGDAAVGTVTGLWSLVRHPIQTAQGVGTAIMHPIQTGQAIIGDIKEKSGTLRGQGNLVGDVLIGIGTAGTVKAAAQSAAVAKVAGKLKKLSGVGRSNALKTAAAKSGGVCPAAGAQAAKVGLPATTEASVADKLERYLLNSNHPVGGPKANWFQQALGFTKENAADLAKQIKFNQAAATVTGVTEHGTKFNQVITIIGANGKSIDVTFAWIKNNDGVVRLVTSIPTPR